MIVKSDDKLAYDRLEKIRWNGTRVCPKCGNSNSGKRYGNKQYHCPKCRTRFTVLTNTGLHGSKMPITAFFAAIRYCAVRKGDFTVRQLSEHTKLSHATSVEMSQKLKSVWKEVFLMSDGADKKELMIKLFLLKSDPAEL